jgi:RNA polymerase sigma-70 factor (ECF subfamily)
MSAQAAAGDAGARLAQALFERHQAEIYGYLRRLVHDDAWAEDLAQETFLRAFEARASLLEVANHRAWLYRVATNLALNALKRRRRFAWLPWRAAERRAARQSVAEAVAGRSAVEAALAALPPELRAPLLLYAHDGLSVAEVAETLSLSEGAVKMRLVRARRAFRQAYEREDEP